jgi:hypothetical protein
MVAQVMMLATLQRGKQYKSIETRSMEAPTKNMCGQARISKKQ